MEAKAGALAGGIAAWVAVIATAWSGTALAAPPDTIRVGGPSTPRAAKVAIVASSAPRVGQTFTVHAADGTQVYSGTLQQAPGQPSPWNHAARADFTAVNRPGTYVIRVGELQSPPWAVRRSADRRLLRRALRVFEINADGDEPNPVFGPAHLNDRHAPIVGGPTHGGTIDVEGGWRDAGDAIKFTTTTAMASVMLDYAAILDPRDAERLQSLSDIGIRWLEKAHPRGSQTFVVMVGDDCDHGPFRHFEQDDASPNPAHSARKAYADAGSGGLGAGAAALALASARDDISDARSARLRRLAREWYRRGKQVAAPGPVIDCPDSPEKGFAQPGDTANAGQLTDWQGFMALAATALYTATGAERYLDDAQRFLEDPATNFYPTIDAYHLVAPVAAADLCGGMGFEDVDHPVRGIACAKLRQVADRARAIADFTPFGTPGEFFFGWVKSHSGAAALLAAAEENNLAPDGLRRAAEARDYLVGRNPWGASFVVGPAPHEAHHPHHSVFLKGDPEVLANGAIVGGPAVETQFDPAYLAQFDGDRFAPFDPTYTLPDYGIVNNRIIYRDSPDQFGQPSNFINGEVGLAYSAPTVLLLAQLIDG